jgi:predicted nuclease of predicted toxin-antitoxin system
VSLAFVVDMNLSAEWLPLLAAEGWPAVHWSAVGVATAPDAAILAWARDAGRAVLTHDQDFGHLLALTAAESPSVVLLKGQDVLPERRGADVVAAVRRHEAALRAGALVVVDVDRSRVRVLPLTPPP